MALTGKKRSLTLEVSRTVAGVAADGYPKVYRGLNAFGSFAAISADQMALMPVADYEARLAAFESYVQTQEPGLDIAATCTVQAYY